MLLSGDLLSLGIDFFFFDSFSPRGEGLKLERTFAQIGSVNAKIREAMNATAENVLVPICSRYFRFYGGRPAETEI